VPRKGEQAAVMASRKRTGGGCGVANGWYWCFTEWKAVAGNNGQNKREAGAGAGPSSSSNGVGRGEEHSGSYNQTRNPS